MRKSSMITGVWLAATVTPMHHIGATSTRMVASGVVVRRHGLCYHEGTICLPGV